jgi:hypothetical protein
MRKVLKACAFIASLLVVSPLVGGAYLERRLSAGETWFTLFAQLLALVPGVLGVYLRGAYYFRTLDECSWETHLGFGTHFTHRGGALGAHVSTGSYCVLGHAKIGPAVMIGSRVSIPSGKRQHLDPGGGLGADTRYDAVCVGEHSWLGEGAIIMASIGRSCIVAAGAVVTTAVPDCVMVGGNPARVIKVLGP